MIQQYFDMSRTSAIIALVVIVLVFFTVRFLLGYLTIKDEESDDPEDMKPRFDNNVTIGISIVFALIIALVALMGYKQYLVQSGCDTFLKEDFNGP